MNWDAIKIRNKKGAAKSEQRLFYFNRVMMAAKSASRNIIKQYELPALFMGPPGP